MPGQKKDRDKSGQNEAGGLSGRTGLDKGNPRPSHRPTLSGSTRLRHRVLVVPRIEYAVIKEA